MNKLEKDYNGYVLVNKRPISKAGIFEYLGSSIGAEDPDRIYKVYRPAEELSNKETIDSFKLVPLIDDHEMLGTDATPAEDKGIQGTTGEDIYFENDTLYGNLKVYSDVLNNLIDNGKKDLSLGYKCKYKFEPGSFNGEVYDAIQTDLKGNHIALVDHGRMGKEVSVCDSAIITFDNNDITTGEIPIMNDELLKALEEMIKPIMEKINELSDKIDGKGSSEEETEDDCNEDEDPDVNENEDSEENEDEKAVDIEEEKKAMAQDAIDAKIALKEEFKSRDKLASEISKVVGSFDHLDMDFREVVGYGLKKLNIKADKGQGLATLKGYLAGSSKVNNTVAMDSQVQNSKFIPSYNIFK
tara:strand:- start:29780 stop:30847 length:1068 start_codon:yes stop_codon:yes gene_type:complete